MLGLGDLIDKGLAKDIKASSFLDSKALEAYKNTKDKTKDFKDIYESFVNLSEFQEKDRRDSYEEKKRDNIMRDVKKYTEEDSNSSYSFDFSYIYFVKA